MKTMTDVLDALADRFGRQCLFDPATKKYVDDVAGDDLPARDRRLLKAAFESGAIGKYRSRDDLEEARRSLVDYTCWSDDAVDRVMSSFSEALGFGMAEDGPMVDGISGGSHSTQSAGDARAVKCVKCGKGIKKGDKFCRHCGTKQFTKLPANGKCSFCGASVANGSSFCHNCGKPIDVDLLKAMPDFVFVGYSETGDFYICDHPVTQAEYESVMNCNPSDQKGERHPVTNVSWFDALGFCNALSARDGLDEPYEFSEGKYAKWNKGANGYRLPMVSEWKWASGGGSKSKEYWYSGDDSIDKVAWYYSNSNGKLHDVKLKKPNELGLYDMNGNVCEWCWDDRGEDEYRIILGGHWGSSGHECHSQDFWFWCGHSDGVGFRLVRSAK